MILKSKKYGTPKIKGMTGDKVEHWYDFLDLKLFDDSNNQYRLGDILDKIYQNEISLQTLDQDTSKNIQQLKNEFLTLKDAQDIKINLLVEGFKELNNKVSKLEEEIKILQNKTKYL